MCPRGERIAWLVESDVPVYTNAKQEQIQTADCRDRFFVAFAFDIEISRDTIEAVSSIGIEIDARQEMLGQEPSKATGVR